jgi:hypothetical protein
MNTSALQLLHSGLHHRQKVQNFEADILEYMLDYFGIIMDFFLIKKKFKFFFGILDLTHVPCVLCVVKNAEENGETLLLGAISDLVTVAWMTQFCRIRQTASRTDNFFA